MQALTDLNWVCEKVESILGPNMEDRKPVGTTVLKYGLNDEIVGTMVNMRRGLAYKQLLHTKIANLNEFNEVYNYQKKNYRDETHMKRKKI